MVSLYKQTINPWFHYKTNILQIIVILQSMVKHNYKYYLLYNVPTCIEISNVVSGRFSQRLHMTKNWLEYQLQSCSAILKIQH
jgi:hypothetical protein